MNRKEFLEKHIKPEQFENNAKNPLFWAREYKMYNQLLAKYGVDFLSYFSLPYKLNSLAFLRSQRGKDELLKQYNSFSFEKKNIIPKEEKVFTNKVGEDKIVHRIPNSILDF